MDQQIAKELFKEMKTSQQTLDVFREIYVRNKVQEIESKIKNLEKECETWQKIINTDTFMYTVTGKHAITKKDLLCMINKLDTPSKNELLLRIRKSKSSQARSTLSHIFTGAKHLSSALM